MALTGFDKAIVAAIVAALGAFLTALQASGGQLGTKEYLAAAATGVVAGIAVYYKANAAAPSVAPAPTIVPPAG